MDAPVIATFHIVITDRTRAADGRYNARTVAVTVAAFGDDDPSLVALQMAAAVAPDDMILGCTTVAVAV